MSRLEAGWVELLKEEACPACGAVGLFGLHARYRKYHYRERIGILRVRCWGCRRTHALMPSFSLAGTSIGTKEAEAYLVGRWRGESRAGAGKLFEGRGMGSRYLKQLERMLERGLARAKAIFPRAADERLEAHAWIEAVCGPTSRPIVSLNGYALEHGVNAILCCRVSILLFCRARRPDSPSRNPSSAGSDPPSVDSG
ncbi:MAG: hypothetical protein WC728_19000 [Elusimicrobiota bacterium]